MPSDRLSGEERAALEARIRRLFGPPDEASPETRRLIRKLVKSSPYPVRIRDTDLALQAGGGYFNFREPRKHVGLHPVLATIPDVLAHEIGHAEYNRDSPLSKYVQSTPARFAHGLSPILAALAAHVAAKKIDSPLAHLVGPAAALTLSAPVLYDEHEAWQRARRLLDEHRASQAALRHMDETKAKALATYWSTPLLAALGAVGVSTLSKSAADAKYTKPGLRERIKSRVMASSDGGKPGQWSARKAQLVAQKYEERGGGYKGGQSEGQESLSTWTKEKWTTSDGKPAERKGGTTRYLPENAWRRLSPGQRAATNAKKREGSRKGEQFVPNTQAAKAARKEAALNQPVAQPPARPFVPGKPSPPPTPAYGQLPSSIAPALPTAPPQMPLMPEKTAFAHEMMRAFSHALLGRLY